MFVHLHLQDFPWIVADEQEVHMQEPRLIPLKTMTSDIVKVSKTIPLVAQFICSKIKTQTSKLSVVIIEINTVCSLILIMFTLPCSYRFSDYCFLTDAAVCGRESPENIVCRNQGYCYTSQSVTTLNHEQVHIIAYQSWTVWKMNAYWTWDHQEWYFP